MGRRNNQDPADKHKPDAVVRRIHRGRSALSRRLLGLGRVGQKEKGKARARKAA